MFDKNFSLEIISPVKTVFEGEVVAVTIPGSLGIFQVLSNHAPMISTFDVGKIKIKKDSEVLEYSTSGGIFEVKNNKAIVLAESIESKEEIDLERANQSKIRAEEILRMAEAKAAEKEEAKLSLQRAINRIKITEKK
ncbi:MAG: ATP synthase F1 subunit epsilon [Bacteroidota bacterium]|nr:ATP synthase F1 subunit epsilon [Bacteroidota bacterium]